MAQRDIYTKRDVTQVIPRVDIQKYIEQPDTSIYQTVEQLAQFGQKIVTDNENARLLEKKRSLSLELDTLESQYKIDYQHDPYSGKDKYQAKRKQLIDMYGKDVSGFFKEKWNKDIEEVKFKNDMSLQGWALKQTQSNTKASVERAIEDSVNKAFNFGIGYGNGEENTLNALSDANSVSEDLYQTISNTIGQESAKAMTEDFGKKYGEAFLRGVLSKDPMKAGYLATQPEFENVDPRVRQMAIDAQVAHQEKIIAQQQKIANKTRDYLIGGKAVEAAVLNGFGDTDVSRINYQKDNGVPKEQMGILTEDEVEDVLYQSDLSNTQGVMQLYVNLMGDSETEQIGNMKINDVLKNENVPKVSKLAIRKIQENNGKLPISYQQWIDTALQGSTNRKQNIEAITNMTTKGSTEAKDIENNVRTQMVNSGLKDYFTRSGMSGEAYNTLVNIAMDAAFEKKVQKGNLDLSATEVAKWATSGLMFGYKAYDGLLVPEDIPWNESMLGNNYDFFGSYSSSYSNRPKKTKDIVKNHLLSAVDEYALPAGYTSNEYYAKSVAKRAEFVNAGKPNADGQNGLILYLDNIPVQDKNGNLVSITFDEIRRLQNVR